VGAKPLRRSELRDFKALLFERCRLLKGDLAGLEGVARAKGSDAGQDQSTVPSHPAELASDTSEKDLAYGRIESHTDELKEIQEAFERIDEGTYGQCEKCERLIPKERLKAIPFARRCVKCQAKEEEEGENS